jgi:hypothetical protein
VTETSWDVSIILQLQSSNIRNKVLTHQQDLYENAEASLVTRIVDVDSHKWGTFQEGYQDGVGSAIVVRADGRDLEIAQLRALVAYFGKAGVGGDIDKIMKKKDVTQRKVYTETKINQASFEVFLTKWMKSNNLKKGWLGVESPFGPDRSAEFRRLGL